jgi:hypothetical protein
MGWFSPTNHSELRAFTCTAYAHVDNGSGPFVQDKSANLSPNQYPVNTLLVTRPAFKFFLV